MGWFRKQYEKGKKSVKAEFKHRSEVRRAEKESYKQAQIKQAKEFGKKKASYETQQKLKELKQRPKSFEFKGFAGPTQTSNAFNLGIGDALVGNNKKKKKGLDDMRLF